MKKNLVVIEELKKQGKPFLILVNSQMPYKEETLQLAESLQKKYGVTTVTANCEQLKKEDITRILEKVLYEFPVSEIHFYVPKWVEMLPPEHYLKKDLIDSIKKLMEKMRYVKDATKENMRVSSEYIQNLLLEKTDLSTGKLKIRVDMDDVWYYEILSEMTGVDISDEYELIHTMQELAKMKAEYVKVQDAISSVKGKDMVWLHRKKTRLSWKNLW